MMIYLEDIMGQRYGTVKSTVCLIFWDGGEPTEIGFRIGNNGDFNARGEILGSSSTRFYYLN